MTSSERPSLRGTGDIVPVDVTLGKRTIAAEVVSGAGRNPLLFVVVEGSGEKPSFAGRVHSAYVGKTATQAAVVTIADGAVDVFLDKTRHLKGLTVDETERLLNAVLAEPGGLKARRRLVRAVLASAADDGLPLGVTNQAMFATHYVTEVAPDSADWDAQCARSAEAIDETGYDLLAALGWELTKSGDGALAAVDGISAMYALDLRGDEQFDHPSGRFNLGSPAAYAIRLAQSSGCSWAVVIRGRQLRLYSTNASAGVGSKGTVDTWFGIDLAVLGSGHFGYLTACFSPEALGPDNGIAQFVDGSVQFAAALGKRLRDRIYAEAVPTLGVAIANQLREHAPKKFDADVAYKITLRVLFRLLFQASAEDSGLLPYGRNEKYTRNSIKTWASDLADPDYLLDEASHAIWDDLLQVWGVIDTGNKGWSVPVINGGLFACDEETHPLGYAITQIKVDDLTVGTALRSLLVDIPESDDENPGAVDYRSLSVREFGTIFEGLLAGRIVEADQPLDLTEKGFYQPAADPESPTVAKGDLFYTLTSGERKNSGAYYTKQFVVDHLLERSLVPAIDTHLAALADIEDDAAAAAEFWQFSVCDPSMGSGHFLLSAIDVLTQKMGAFLSERRIPAVINELNRLRAAAVEALGADEAALHEITNEMLLRRQIARRCIYGIDINETAVELARVAIWQHTFVPGLPMSALDSNLICGNTLTGIATINEALNELTADKDAAVKGGSIFAGEIEEALGAARTLLAEAAAGDEATKAEIKDGDKKRAAGRKAAEHARLIFDGAVALRLGWIPRGSFPDLDAYTKAVAAPDVAARIAALQPAHLPYLFPALFLDDNPGFFVVVGNPPWDEITVERHSWWWQRFPGLRSMKQKDRDAELDRLAAEHIRLADEYAAEVETTNAYRAVVAAGPFPGIGIGDIDLYKAFCWRYWQMLREHGHMGVVLPGGVLKAKGSSEWRNEVLISGTFSDVTMVMNTKQWVFADVHPQYTFGFVAATRTVLDGRQVRWSGPFHNRAEFDEGRLNRASVDPAEFKGWTPTSSFPDLSGEAAAAVMAQMKTHPRFSSSTGFDLSRPLAELHMTNDKKKGLFGVDLDPETRLGDLPVWAGSTFNLWEPNFGDPVGYANEQLLTSRLLDKSKRGTRSKASAFHGLIIGEPADIPVSRARIAFRDVTKSNNTRTAVFGLVPPKVALTNKAPYLVRRSGDEIDEAYLLGICSSIPFDWYARRWVEINLNFFILEHFPVPRPGRDDLLRKRVVELSGRLAAADDRFEVWAEAVGVPVGSLTEMADAEGRFDAICELDALAATLYGLSRQQVELVFSEFHRGWDRDNPANATLYDFNDRLGRVFEHFDTHTGAAKGAKQ